jgi:GT2 family glycosyltransferase
MSMPDVTVSIVNHSNREEVIACLDALTAAGFRHAVEVVVLDNASEDGSVEAIEAAHPEVRVIAQRHRAGFGANHNAIYEATESRFVLFLNDDSAMEPSALDALIEFLDANPDVGAVAPEVVGTDGHRQQTAWRARTPLRSLVFALTLAQAGFVQSQGGEALDAEVLSAAALLVRREALGDEPPFDERFFMYCEDEDLSRRIRARGSRLVYLPTVSVTHAGALSSAEVPERRVNEIWRSLPLLARKHHGRLGGLVVTRAIGTGRALIGSAMWLVAHLPAPLRPARAANWSPRGAFLQAANAWRGVRGPGLRELAEEWNAEHGVARALDRPS